MIDISTVEHKKGNCARLFEPLKSIQRNFLYARLVSENDTMAAEKIGMNLKYKFPVETIKQWKIKSYFKAVYKWCLELPKHEDGLDTFAALQILRHSLPQAVGKIGELAQIPIGELMDTKCSNCGARVTMRVPNVGQRQQIALKASELIVNICGGGKTGGKNLPEFNKILRELSEEERE